MRGRDWLAGWWSRRWVRWAVVVAVYGAAGVVWRTVTGKTWLDALVFLVLVTVVNVVAQWTTSWSRRKATVRDG